MAQKLDFQISYGTRLEPIKARIFQGIDGSTYANIHGDLFNDTEISLDRLDQLISVLQQVRLAVLSPVQPSDLLLECVSCDWIGSSDFASADSCPRCGCSDLTESSDLIGGVND